MTPEETDRHIGVLKWLNFTGRVPRPGLKIADIIARERERGAWIVGLLQRMPTVMAEPPEVY